VKDYAIHIRFIATDTHKLPIAHTCSNELEIPKYKSYEQMKNKLSVAFAHAYEGFGFA
jgi:Ubiquitin-protein ligase